MFRFTWESYLFESNRVDALAWEMDWVFQNDLVLLTSFELPLAKIS